MKIRNNKRKISNIVMMCAISGMLLTGCKDKKSEKPELVNNSSTTAEVSSENSKISQLKEPCPEINEIVNMGKVNCVSSSIIRKQVELRVADKITKAYGLEYTDADIMHYFQEQIDKSDNKILSKPDVADKMEAEILMVGLENYARDHKMDFLREQIKKKEYDRIANKLTDVEKQDLINEYSKVYLSIGMDQKAAEKAAINDYINNAVDESVSYEAEEYARKAKEDIFKEMMPDKYNALPDHTENTENAENTK